MQSYPRAAIFNAEALPIPEEAPVMNAIMIIGK
jgi:hypothetical protein